MKVEIKGYKYDKADFAGMDFETFTLKFGETFKDCNLKNCYKLLTGCNPVLKSTGQNGKPKKSTGKS